MRRHILNEQHPNAPDEKALINRCTAHIRVFIYLFITSCARPLCVSGVFISEHSCVARSHD